jgi:CDP-diacylglycerol--serine O-phosphatidyltransferase
MKRVALIPNIFTTGNMVAGLAAMLFAFTAVQTGEPREFEKACFMILLAMLLDGLDGKIAVLTRSTSDFGVQYDSMADLVSFGVAPAFLLVSYFELQETGPAVPSPFCWAMTVILVVSVGLRLARFNLQVEKDEKRSFEGLPSPTPAGLISLMLLSTYHCEWGVGFPQILLFFVVLVLGGLMVSHIPYPSLKKSDFFKAQPLSTLFLVVLVFALVAMEPVGTALLGLWGYVGFGLTRHFAPNFVTDQVSRLLEPKS